MSESRGRLEVSVLIRVRYGSAAEAEAILKATAPDNFKAPQGTNIESELAGSEIHLTVTSTKGLGSLISTVDDLLSCMQAAEKAIGGIG